MFEYVERRSTFWLRHVIGRLVPRSTGVGLPRLCAFPDDLIGREMAVAGLYERAGVEALRWLCSEGVVRNASEGGLLDIGANLGTYAISLCGSFSDVLAFEPNPISSRLLRLNVEINGCDNVEIHPVALSNATGTGELSEPGGNVGASRLLESDGGTGRYQVPLVTGDDLLRGYGALRVAMIKIDVEGHEGPALEGLRGTILRDRPVICFEVNDNVSYQAVRQVLAPMGYGKFDALDYWPSPRLTWMKTILLTVFGVRHRLRSLPAEISPGRKYSLVIARSETA